MILLLAAFFAVAALTWAALWMCAHWYATGYREGLERGRCQGKSERLLMRCRAVDYETVYGEPASTAVEVGVN